MLKNDYLETLQANELYLLDAEAPGMHLLYAPLADSILPVSDEDAVKLAEAMEYPQKADPEVLEIADALRDVEPVSAREGHVRGAGDFINLSILPNNVCNFSCSYCYSAKGRSSRRLSLGAAKRMVDYFLDRNRNASDFLTVSIFGGGEPLLSWKDLVKPVIEYFYQSAGEGRRIVTTLITNGSIVTDDFIDICRKHNIDLVCSYEILRDVQDSQRRHYDLVRGNIGKLIQNGVVPAINSVITDLNVERQVEMIEALKADFPEIRYVSFEPVISEEQENRDEFYRRFTLGFLKALAKAEENGIILSCSALRNVDVTVDRYCAGELALCADGSLSVCPCVSSPEEPEFDRYIYGKADEDGVHIDEEKLSSLLKMNVYSQPWCSRCFAKWNCGGGCINSTLKNGGRQIPSYCRFVRRFLKYTLTRRLDQAWQEENGVSIKEMIGDYERFVTE